MNELLALLAPWITLGNLLAVASLFVFVGRKLSVFDRLVLDQAKAESRAQDHSDKLSRHDRRLVILEVLAEQAKGLPEQVARLVAIMERMEET